MAKKQASEATPLKGKELLKKLKEIDHLSRTEKARECGYETTGGGKSRVNLSQFMNEILAAKGISLDSEEKSDRRGRDASYRVKVNKNGQLLIGSAYTAKMGLQIGDEFEIKLGRKQLRLKLVTEGD
ncbi:MAG: AbrB family transcriptional regulator [Thermosynechococcaceae cyanobacterium]